MRVGTRGRRSSCEVTDTLPGTLHYCFAQKHQPDRRATGLSMDLKLLIRRILARLIDLVVIYIILGLLFSIDGDPAGFVRILEAITQGVEVPTDDKFQALIAIFYLLLMILVWSVAFFYEVPFTAVCGQTLGKAITRIQVVIQDSQQSPPGFWRSVGRWFVIWSWITVMVWVPTIAKVILLLITLVINVATWKSTRPQFLHEVFTDTVVIKS